MTSLTNVQGDAIGSEAVGEADWSPGDAPYLSVVATARNDNHGGDLIARMQTFVNGLAAQCERHRLETELILVEWNPPADRPGLADALEWPDTPWCAIRIIEVPHELHARLNHADRLPLFQMIAKNVGIRRARGEFVLVTNVDILFPDALMRDLARRNLRPDRLYRVDRHDADIEPDPSLPIDETMRSCTEHTIRVCAKGGTTDLLTGTYYRIYENPDLWLFARRILYFVRAGTRRLRWCAAFVAAGIRWLAASVAHGKPQPTEVFEYLSHRRRFTVLGLWRAVVRRTRLVAAAWQGEGARVHLHTNASGDFTLLSREAWETTRGYPELEMFSMHLDGTFLYQAHYAGFAEVVLREPIFHIEHSQGFKPQPAEVRTLNSRLERAAIPQITNEQFLRWITTMYRTKRPIEFNSESWGLRDTALREITPAATLDAVRA